MSGFHYVTVSSGDYIKTHTQYALKSLLKSGIPSDDISCVVNTNKDLKLISNLVPEVKSSSLNINLSKVCWRNKRKFSFLKSAALARRFSQPIPGKNLVYFDGDVLWYKDPSTFLNSVNHKTWFHHGKCLEGRAKIKRSKVNIKKLSSLSKWVSKPTAYMLIKNGITKLPEREVVAGMYVLHADDQEKVLTTTFKYCRHLKNKFCQHEGAGDQKPMNAALSVLGIDWHGGSRYESPEHIEYFEHFMGHKIYKGYFLGMVNGLGLISPKEYKRHPDFVMAKKWNKRANIPTSARKIKDSHIFNQIVDYEKKRDKFLKDFFNER